MTVTEFKNEFNIGYDSVSSNMAPNLDDYEISVFLTRAQEQLVKNKFDPNSNQKRKGFENTSKRRWDLKELIKDYKSMNEVSIDKHIDPSSKFYAIPSDVYLIVQEQVVIYDSSCNNSEKIVDVKPKTYDEYNDHKDSPFKKPYKKQVWRLDYNSSAGNNVVELISTENIKSYNLRYIKKPSPIIISDLSSFGEGLTIEGLFTPKTSELDSTVHPEIVDRAVELAIASYRQNNLETKITVDSRNE